MIGKVTGLVASMEVQVLQRTAEAISVNTQAFRICNNKCIQHVGKRDWIANYGSFVIFTHTFGIKGFVWTRIMSLSLLEVSVQPVPSELVNICPRRGGRGICFASHLWKVGLLSFSSVSQFLTLFAYILNLCSLLVSALCPRVYSVTGGSGRRDLSLTGGKKTFILWGPFETLRTLSKTPEHRCVWRHC